MIRLKEITGIKPAKLNGDKNERKGGDKGDAQISSAAINQMMRHQEKKKVYLSRMEDNVLGL